MEQSLKSKDKSQRTKVKTKNSLMQKCVREFLIYSEHIEFTDSISGNRYSKKHLFQAH